LKDGKVGLGWEMEDDARGWIEATLMASFIIFVTMAIAI